MGARHCLSLMAVGVVVVVGPSAAIAAETVTSTASGRSPLPEEVGPHEHSERTMTATLPVDPAGPSGANPQHVDVHVYLPSASGPAPTIEILNGFCDGADELASYGRHLASWGFVVLSAAKRTDPCETGIGQFFAEDDAPGDNDWRVDIDDSLEILRWSAKESATPGSALFGKVDTSRLVVSGFSYGARTAEYAVLYANRNPNHDVTWDLPPIRALMLLDAASRRADIASQVDVPTLVLGAQLGSWFGAEEGFALLPNTIPKLGIEITGAHHEEFDDSQDSADIGRGSLDEESPAVQDHKRLMRRYSGAFLRYYLQNTRSLAPYVGTTGSEVLADVKADRIRLYEVSTEVRHTHSK